MRIGVIVCIECILSYHMPHQHVLVKVWGNSS